MVIKEGDDTCSNCGSIYPRGLTLYRACIELKDIEKYNAMPRAEWDEKGYLYSDALDKYFTDLDHAQDYLEEGQSLSDLRLIICEPNFAHELEPDDFADELPEDGDAPDWLEEAIESFNKAIKEGGRPIPGEVEGGREGRMKLKGWKAVRVGILVPLIY